MPFLRKYNTLTVTGTTAIRIPMIKRGVVDFAVGADWTPASGDVKILVDGTAAANVTNLPTAIAAGNGAVWEFILTAAELSCKQCEVVIADSATKAVEDNSFIVETFGNASAMYVPDYSAALATPTNITAGTITTVGTLTTYTGNTPQTGDCYPKVDTEVATLVTGVADIQTSIAGLATPATVATAVLSAAAVSPIAATTTSNIKKNQALAKFQFLMTDSTTHNPVPGKTVTCTRAIDSGTQAAGTLANVTEGANGTYLVDFGAADLNGNVILLRATASGCDDTFERIITQP